MTSAGQVGPLELLVIQPTPFCNLDCSYCYLPDRSNKRKMTLETLEKTFNWVFSSGLVRQPFTLLWHAGEPMVNLSGVAASRSGSASMGPISLTIVTV